MKRFQLQSVRSCQIYNFDIKIVFIRDRMKIVFIENDYQKRANCYLNPFAACGTPTNHFFFVVVAAGCDDFSSFRLGNAI
jgi:hypothetical protein